MRAIGLRRTQALAGELGEAQEQHAEAIETPVVAGRCAAEVSVLRPFGAGEDDGLVFEHAESFALTMRHGTARDLPDPRIALQPAKEASLAGVKFGPLGMSAVELVEAMGSALFDRDGLTRRDVVDPGVISIRRGFPT